MALRRLHECEYSTGTLDYIHASVCVPRVCRLALWIQCGTQSVTMKTIIHRDKLNITKLSYSCWWVFFFLTLAGSSLPRMLPLSGPTRVEALFAHTPGAPEGGGGGGGGGGGACLLHFLPGDSIALLISEPRDGWHYGQNERTGRYVVQMRLRSCCAEMRSMWTNQWKVIKDLPMFSIVIA